jgi:hypothetical protein
MWVKSRGQRIEDRMGQRLFPGWGAIAGGKYEKCPSVPVFPVFPSGATLFFNELTEWAENPTQVNLEKTTEAAFDSTFVCIVVGADLPLR